MTNVEVSVGTEMDVEGLYEFEQRFKDLAECADRLIMKPSSPMWSKGLDGGYTYKSVDYDFYVEGDSSTKPLAIENGMIRLA